MMKMIKGHLSETETSMLVQGLRGAGGSSGWVGGWGSTGGAALEWGNK